MDESDSAIVAEYERLAKECQAHFDSLHQVPSFGQSHWRSYFSVAFDSFTALWKLQKQHRDLLVQHCGLTRAQIGDVASRIGQLYLHFYHRTAQLSYLKQAMTFFDAIRARKYYSTAEETNPRQAERCQGKLFRSLARYVVVALLLQLPSAFISSLLDEMTALSEAAHDVAQEARQFISTLTEPFSAFEQLSLRLSSPSTPLNPPPESMQAVLVSAVSGQVRFSELSVDLFRMALALEHAGSDLEHHNPTKHLLYKPQAATVVSCLATMQQEAQQPTRLQLIYLATGNVPTPQASDNSSIKTSPTATHDSEDPSSSASGVYLPGRNAPQADRVTYDCLHPRDLCFAFKQPTILVLDAQSDALGFDALLDLGPSLLLFSPAAWQVHVRRSGSVFTLLLTQPVSGLVRLCRGDKPALRDLELGAGEETWERMFASASSQVVGAHMLLHDAFVVALVTRLLLVRLVLKNLKYESTNIPQMLPSLTNVELELETAVAPGLVELCQRLKL
eukprot:m.40788 g.40788  ORF g.40788 m.40788 type:complete len:505 (-) comp12779_c0_seq2:40-1554(-)